MVRLNILNFENGVDYIVKTILEGEEKPVLVSIHGVPNSGKSKLRRTVQDKLWTDFKKLGWSSMCDTSLERFDLSWHIENPEFFLIEDLVLTISVNRYTKENFGRVPDLKVYIAKRFSLSSLPKILRDYMEKEKYDLIIENPKAEIKMPGNHI